MLLRGITPPEVGSVRDKVLTRMYAMEQADKFEVVATLGSLITAASRPTKETVNNVERIIEAYRGSLAFGNWSNERKLEAQRRELSDQDILERVALLGKKK